ncbi:MAG: hypothetical protein AUH30_16490 [Candidatus Rokubacteria bacterium 13_1_40CM_68_15]|nr:MAG: hypothetical protein AUH30_16490 [Candidatus Rokubacteria bacterium 13_1_40CM_68_15]
MLTRRSFTRRVVVFAAFGASASWLASAAASSLVPQLPDGVPGAERARVTQMAQSADVATRVDATPFVASLHVFEYLLDHPEFATHVTRTLRLARYRVWQTPRGLYLDDGWGGTGYFWVVYAGNGTRLMRARGEFKQTFMPTIQGDAVTMIEYEATPAPEGKSLIRSTVSGYVKLDSRFLANFMKLASGAAQRKADLEARRLMRTFARASQAIDENPAGVYEQLRQRPDVPQRELEEFGRLLNVR